MPRGTTPSRETTPPREITKEEEVAVRKLPPLRKIVPVESQSESPRTAVEQVADLEREVLTPDEKRHKLEKIRDYIRGQAEYLTHKCHEETLDKFRELFERENEWKLQDDNIKKLSKMLADDSDMSKDESAKEIDGYLKRLQDLRTSAKKALETLSTSKNKDEAYKAHKRFKELKLPKNPDENEQFEGDLIEVTRIKNNYIQKEINIYNTFIDLRSDVISKLEEYAYKNEELDEEPQEIAVPRSDTRERSKTPVEQIAAMAERIMTPEPTKSSEDEASMKRTAERKRKAEESLENERPPKKFRENENNPHSGIEILHSPVWHEEAFLEFSEGEGEFGSDHEYYDLDEQYSLLRVEIDKAHEHARKLSKYFEKNPNIFMEAYKDSGMNSETSKEFSETVNRISTNFSEQDFDAVDEAIGKHIVGTLKVINDVYERIENRIKDLLQQSAKVLTPQNEGNYERYEGSVFPATAVESKKAESSTTQGRRRLQESQSKWEKPFQQELEKASDHFSNFMSYEHNSTRHLNAVINDTEGIDKNAYKKIIRDVRKIIETDLSEQDLQESVSTLMRANESFQVLEDKIQDKILQRRNRHHGKKRLG